MKFDLNVEVIPDDQLIWAVFPGEGRRFFPRFLDEEIVFLNMPKLDLNASALNNDNILRQHTAMSLAWRAYYLGSDDKVPSRNPQSYAVPTDQSFRNAFANVRGLYSKMKKGDLIIVGQYDQYEPVLIGEIADNFDLSARTSLERYGDEQIYVRSVNWLSTDRERRHLSRGLSQFLSSRRAVVTIDTDFYGEEIFKLAYGDFSYKEKSRYVFDGKNYENFATSTIPGIRLITYFCAAFLAIEYNELEDFIDLGVDDAIEKYFDNKALSSFEIEFASPGEYVVDAKRAAMAVFVALMVSATAGDEKISDLRKADVINHSKPGITSSPDKMCHEVKDKFEALMNAAHHDQYLKWCKLNKNAQDGVGLQVKIKKSP